ncbi:hypothetical protein OSB04_013338 [Centaurea solstitialis]|uniref:F-box domain-containing protein n=1 Tax=Centaurea solstitialis TaxID=347529 RepID=A0AA38WQJ9_9ASTR|nr:hypothetical protein OSB04_013338 [Centaurea solstitialis]
MAIAELHEDIIKTHILTRLDGQTLAAAASTSSRLQSLCSDPKLWSDICSSNWPSTDDVLVAEAISNFPSGHRSFFSDAFPSPAHRLTTAATTASIPTSRIICAVDLRYGNDLVFSKVESTNTTPSDWFRSSPFRVDLLEPKEIVPSSVKITGDGDDHVILSSLQDHVTLSWIMIDPTRNRAVDLSSVRPVSVQRNWLTGDIELTFAVVVSSEETFDHVSCNILVTCGVKEGGELHVSGVSLTVLDVDGKCLSGKDSMVILQGLAVAPRRGRKHGHGGGEERERYEEYVQRRRERNEITERRERRLDMACVASGVGFFVAFWSFALF